MWLAHKVDYRYYAKISKLVLILSVPLLLYTWVFGTNINEASRWITIPVINQAFQPSDLAKLALIITLANMLAKRQQDIQDFKKVIIPMLIWIGIICGLIAMTNISTGILLFITCMLVLFIGRVPVKYLAMLVLIGGISGTVAIAFGQRGNTALSRTELRTTFIKKHPSKPNKPMWLSRVVDSSEKAQVKVNNEIFYLTHILILFTQ